MEKQMFNETRNVHFLKTGEDLVGAAKTGVSLHCHTLHSRELLDFVPYYAERIPIASYFLRREMRKYELRGLTPPDFKTGYWTPPLTGAEVFNMESASMKKLGLDGLVSITDHDSINANLELREERCAETTPISMEWTVPFEEAFFHVGVHNLPIERATEISEMLIGYSKADGWPDSTRLGELFALLNELPDVLVVLNHPVWDIEMIGQERHERALARFLADHSASIHAIEINGFRTWRENLAAIHIAESLNLPIVSGGDRHCMHSNTMVNLTDASSFAEFVSEVRTDGHSRIAVTPEYHIPLPSRQLASIAQIMGNYQNFPEGRRIWSDRVYLDGNGSGLSALTEQWNGRPPLWTTATRWAINLLAHPWMRPVIGLLVGDKDIGSEGESRVEQEIVIGSFPAAAQR